MEEISFASGGDAVSLPDSLLKLINMEM